MNDSAKELKNKGWSIVQIREYLRFNYPESTCSAIEDAIRSAFGSI